MQGGIIIISLNQGVWKMNVLVINAGSSSLKYQLFDMETETVAAKGICERIGIDGRLKHTALKGEKREFKAEIPCRPMPRPSTPSSKS